MHAHTHIYTMHEGGWDEILIYPPPRPEPRKAWHGLSRNQGVVGEHDGQYQLPAGTWVSSGLRQKRWYAPL
jgi:hypothetical protein